MLFRILTLQNLGTRTVDVGVPPVIEANRPASVTTTLTDHGLIFTVPDPGFGYVTILLPSHLDRWSRPVRSASGVGVTLPLATGLTNWTYAVPDLKPYGRIESIAVALGSEGSGYVNPTVVIGPPDMANGVQATATATVTSGQISAITITNAGTGYTKPPAITITEAKRCSGQPSSCECIHYANELHHDFE